MLSNILIVRHDVHILNIGLTIIHLRKALNALFYRIQSRGTLLIYAEAHNALNLNHDSVFIFANSWLPGLLTNYRRVSLSVAITKFHKAYLSPFLSRTQLAAIDNVRVKPFLKSLLRFRKGLLPRIPRLPSISFSVLDNFIWLNECHNLKIPSIQLCDTQSSYDYVTYPIVANQRSVPLASLVVDLFSEVCTNALLSSHLTFISYYRAKQFTLPSFRHRTRNKKRYLRMTRFSAIIKRTLLRKFKRKKKFRLKNRRIRIRRLFRKLKKTFVAKITKRYIYRAYLRIHRFQKKRKVKTLKNKKIRKSSPTFRAILDHKSKLASNNAKLAINLELIKGLLKARTTYKKVNIQGIKKFKPNFETLFF